MKSKKESCDTQQNLAPQTEIFNSDVLNAQKKICSFWEPLLGKHFSREPQAFKNDLIAILKPENEDNIVKFLFSMTNSLAAFNPELAELYYDVMIYRLMTSKSQQPIYDLQRYWLEVEKKCTSEKQKSQLHNYFIANPLPCTAQKSELMLKILTEKRFCTQLLLADLKCSIAEYGNFYFDLYYPRILRDILDTPIPEEDFPLSPEEQALVTKELNFFWSLIVTLDEVVRKEKIKLHPIDLYVFSTHLANQNPDNVFINGEALNCYIALLQKYDYSRINMLKDGLNGLDLTAGFPQELDLKQKLSNLAKEARFEMIIL